VSARMAPALKHSIDTLEIYLAHRAALIDYAAPIVGCRARAEDVVQEAWFRFASRPEREEIAQPVGYLYRIVRNLALDWARRLSTERRSVGNHALVNPVPPAPSAEHEALYRDELRLVIEALAELPERTRIAFEMRRLGGCTLREIADELGISITLAHQLVREALVRCARKLGEPDA
jgi:RNA polymerase sigma factor (sigma-70 family)